MRLAYDELLATSSRWRSCAARNKRQAGRSNEGDGATCEARSSARCPIRLTKSQEQALGEIVADMAEPTRMLRLLQGDVGSGKTVVALLAMLNAVEAGGQAALMAPTEILARQHFATLEPLCEAVGQRVALLTGRDKGKARDAMLARPGGRRAEADRRHPCAGPGGRRVPRPAPRGHRRAAPLRRRAAPGARRQGRRRRHAGDDRDADPAHADADRLWRSSTSRS